MLAYCWQGSSRLGFESAHAFTVTGGEVTKAKRLEKGKNVRLTMKDPGRPYSQNDRTRRNHDSHR